jgi:hypothetical protein
LKFHECSQNGCNIVSPFYILLLKYIDISENHKSFPKKIRDVCAILGLDARVHWSIFCKEYKGKRGHILRLGISLKFYTNVQIVSGSKAFAAGSKFHIGSQECSSGHFIWGHFTGGTAGFFRPDVTLSLSRSLYIRCSLLLFHNVCPPDCPLDVVAVWTTGSNHPLGWYLPSVLSRLKVPQNVIIWNDHPNAYLRTNTEYTMCSLSLRTRFICLYGKEISRKTRRLENFGKNKCRLLSSLALLQCCRLQNSALIHAD